MALDFLTLPDLLADPDYQGFWPQAVSPDGRYILINKYQALWVLDRATELAIEAFDPDTSENYSSVAIDNDGTLYLLANPSTLFGTGALVKITNFGNGTQTTLATGTDADTSLSLGLFIMPDASKKLVWGENVDTNAIKVYTIGTGLASVVNSAPNAVIQTRQDSYGDVWAISSTISSITFQRVVNGGAGTAAPNYQAITLTTAVQNGVFEVYHTSAGWFVCWDGGNELYLLDDTDFSILVHRDYGSGTGSVLNSSLFTQPPFLLGLAPGDDDFWFPGPNSYTNSAYSDLHQINAADLTSLDTHDISDWAIGDQPDAGQGMIYSIHTKTALISGSRQDPPSDDPPSVADYTPVLRYFAAGSGSPIDGDGDGLTDDDVRHRVWGFSLDGHKYVVFRLGPSASLIFDRTTRTWSEWESPGRDNWRAHVGWNWVGMSADSFATPGTDVVAGDDASGVLFRLDPEYGRDDRSTTASDYFTRAAIGLVTLDGRETAPCGAVTLSLSLGHPSQSGAYISLLTSDDQGQTWLDHGSKLVSSADYSTVIEWRGLGLMRAPGRVFKFSDNGACVRLSAADMR